MEGQHFRLEGERRRKVKWRVARQEVLCFFSMRKRAVQGVGRSRFACWSGQCAAEEVLVDHGCKAEVNRAQGERRSFKRLRIKTEISEAVL